MERLQEELAAFAESAAAGEPDARLQEELDTLRRDYRQLQDEYAKLQTEFNEWIELELGEQGR
ncbi:hypothetical protein [Gordoniibacillus kamchatkensis]|uniref:hypothetical protein n=1 Tax=Gordoniibacillus kamchatkensis TaxID=1590651 RepID=UPI0012E00756|nr:hypothetical protein [Paenibacillus sp. VKM B-2647]